MSAGLSIKCEKESRVLNTHLPVCVPRDTTSGIDVFSKLMWVHSMHRKQPWLLYHLGTDGYETIRDDPTSDCVSRSIRFPSSQNSVHRRKWINQLVEYKKLNLDRATLYGSKVKVVACRVDHRKFVIGDGRVINTKASTTANALTRRIVAVFGESWMVVTDTVPCFRSSEFKNMCCSSTANKTTGKMDNRWTRPWWVLQFLTPVTVLLQDWEDSAVTGRCHVSLSKELPMEVPLFLPDERIEPGSKVVILDPQVFPDEPCTNVASFEHWSTSRDLGQENAGVLAGSWVVGFLSIVILADLQNPTPQNDLQSIQSPNEEENQRR
uniref:Uncharacterized protein n=1 Tax=Timema cristinae TaxID=61476 RepID=A0A7R9DDA9_TIMCR|nr:unnamed protein product [Timema cristinae]